MNPVASLLQELVRIPSVNPDGSAPGPHTGEKRVALRVGEVLSALGAEVTYDEVKPDRPNVIGRFPSDRPDKPRVLLAPHTDTVGVDGMTIDPFGGVIRDGKLWGRGASDTKGTMAAMLAALEELGPEGISRLGAEITFVGFMAEETGQHGSRHFAEHHRGYDFALIGEPTLCDTVHCHRGSCWITLETDGIACHASTPERGRSAILAMSQIIVGLETEFRALLRSDTRWQHSVLGSPSVSVGLIKGGSRTNIVPDHCEVSIDIRQTPALAQGPGGDGLLRQWLDAHGFEAARITRVDSAPALDTSTDNPFVQKLAGLGSALVGAPWLCDACWLAEAGIPGVAAGPGSIEQAHTKDEFISLDHLDDGVRFYRRFLESL